MTFVATSVGIQPELPCGDDAKADNGNYAQGLGERQSIDADGKAKNRPKDGKQGEGGKSDPTQSSFPNVSHHFGLVPTASRAGNEVRVSERPVQLLECLLLGLALDALPPLTTAEGTRKTDRRGSNSLTLVRKFTAAELAPHGLRRPSVNLNEIARAHRPDPQAIEVYASILLLR
jgi:hypothetical protein